MSDFKWRHFRGGMILGCVRWYCKYRISYRDLAQMMLERGNGRCRLAAALRPSQVQRLPTHPLAF
jgi:transposase-like protein